MMKCSGCSREQRGLLHHVRHRGDHRRYCSGCVLKNHPGSFCFNCFDVFEGPPPSDSIIKCSNCPSLSHSTCAAAAAAGGSTSSSSSSSSSRLCLSLCPTCSNPSFLFFKASPVLDLASAKVLLAASTIASQSMRKAAAAAKHDADRKVREAAFARKRAREALEKSSVALLMPPPPSAAAVAKGKHHITNNKVSSIAAVAAAAAASTASAEQRPNVAAAVKMKSGSITTPSRAATAAASHKRLPNTSMMPPPTLKEKEEKLQTIAAPPIVQLQRLPRANIAVREPKVAASELVGNDNVSTTTRPTINAKDGSESKAKSGIVLTGT